MRSFIIISGLIFLLFGRKLFWFFVAILGFIAGMTIGESVFSGQPKWIILLISIGAGVIGVLITMLAQRVAFALAGFYAGSYLTFVLAQLYGVYSPSTVLCIAGGIIGALLALLFMDWAIIMLSCLVGAGAVVGALDIGQTGGVIVFVVLMTTGVMTQSRFMGNRK
jgi:hypothetical protein